MYSLCIPSVKIRQKSLLVAWTFSIESNCTRVGPVISSLLGFMIGTLAVTPLVAQRLHCGGTRYSSIELHDARPMVDQRSVESLFETRASLHLKSSW